MATFLTSSYTDSLQTFSPTPFDSKSILHQTTLTVGEFITFTTTNNNNNNTTWILQNHTTMNVEAFLQDLSDRMAVTFLPAILMISTIMIIATIGNTMVFYVYFTKFNPSSTRSAILALALFDLVASCVSMPGEIIDLRYSYNFRSDALCKCFRMGTTVVLVASGLTLLVVAWDRYRRICHPMRYQMTAGMAKKGALLCLLTAGVFSVPSVVVYGISKVPTPVEGIYGEECSIDQKYHGHILPLINNILQGLIFGTVFVAILVLYGLLGRVVLRQNKFRQSVRKTSKQEEDRDHSITDGTRDCPQNEGSVSPVPDIVPEGSYQPTSSKDTAMSPDRKRSISSALKMAVSRQKTSRQTSTNGDARTRKTTLMLFIITVVFVISFLPYLILKGIQAIKKDFPTNASTSVSVLYNVFVRSYFFNSAGNCFIYGFCSPKFRRESKRVFIKLLCCLKKQ